MAEDMEEDMEVLITVEVGVVLRTSTTGPVLTTPC